MLVGGLCFLLWNFIFHIIQEKGSRWKKKGTSTIQHVSRYLQVPSPIHPSKKRNESLVYLPCLTLLTQLLGLPRTCFHIPIQPFPSVQGSEKATTLESQRKQSNARWKWTKLLTSLRGESYQLPIIPKVNKGPGFMLDFDNVSNTWCLKVVHIYIYLEYGFGLHHLSWIWFTHVMGTCIGKVDDLTI